MTNAEKQSLADLFKVVPSEDLNTTNTLYMNLEDCLRYGYIVVTKDSVVENIPKDMFDLLKDTIGINRIHFNTTFHKSFDTVANMSADEYYLHQAIHYLSTYGAEYWGIESTPYIPLEKMDIPEDIVSINSLVVISAVSMDEINYLINSFAVKTRAPSSRMINLFKPLIPRVSVSLDYIKSFELMVMVAESNNVVPETPISFLRFLVYKATNSTLLIKNEQTINSIKIAINYQGFDPTPYFEQVDLYKLSSIFFRYKPIFLAFKAKKECRPYINKLRRYADKTHKPLPEATIQNMSKLVRKGDMDTVISLARGASNQELIKLYNFFKSRFEPGPAAYKIRNGRVFVDAEANTKLSLYDAEYIQNFLYTELVARLKPSLKGRAFIIPEYIHYAVPVSEKQFTGNISWGSYITPPTSESAYTIGIAWNNGPRGERTDIDLHLNSLTRHFGWNGGYGDGNIIYTGDMTDATNGAAEAFWFNPANDSYIVSASRFSGPIAPTFKMFMTEAKPQAGTRNYTFDPSTALFNPITLAFAPGNDSMTLGIFLDERFYFYGGSLTHSNVPRGNYEDYICAISHGLRNQMNLQTLLLDCGAIVVTDKLAGGLVENAIDLSPAALTATSLTDLII